MSNPLFSCVVPVKGSRRFFDESLASIERQGIGDDLEIIVQDGDSESDSGQSDALNKGFAKAKGEWLFWLNADDVLLPGTLRKVSDMIGGRDGTRWIAGDTVYIDEKGTVTEVRTDARWHPWFGRRLSVWTGGPSAFFSRELWEKHGGFDTSLRYAMDIDMWTRWAKAGERFYGLDDYVWGFRLHGASKTGSGRFASEQAKELAAVDKRYGVSTMGFWRNMTRIASFADGTWTKRRRDTARMRGMRVSELQTARF